MKLFTTVCCLAALATAGSANAEDGKTVEVTLKGVTLNVPASWEKQPSASSMRLATFRIPAVDGDDDAAELAVFGHMGGGVAANLTRWIDQFEASGRKAKVTKGKTDNGVYYVADVTGTFGKPDGPPILRKTKPAPGYGLLGVMVQVEGQGNYFLKLTGPEKTVKAQAEALRKAFGGTAKSEEPHEI